MNVANDSLTTSQSARRQRVLVVAMRLAADGGYDAVQMRDVAASADVALGTLYRYFASKDHLLAETLVEWTRDLQRRVAEHPALGVGPAERVTDIIRRATRNMEREPALTAALITAMSSPDPAVKPCQAEVGDIMFDVLAAAMPDMDDELRSGICRVLTHVWFSALIGWVNGWGGGVDVAAEVEVAARLLFR